MSDWQSKAASKRASIRASIPTEWLIDGVSPTSVPRALDFPFHNHLSPLELEITSLSVVELLARIAGGEYSSVAVVRAFAHRAAIAQQLVNCCMEFFWEMAEQQAHGLDEYFAKYGKTVGPLHGLPISLKGTIVGGGVGADLDQFRVKGLETSMGYIAWLGKVETSESVFTEILRKLGAVFYGTDSCFSG
jgi:amidase